MMVARFTLALRQSYDLHEIQLDTKRGFVGAKVFYREYTLAYPQPLF